MLRVRKYLLRQGSGMYWVISPRLGTGWTSESTQRTAMRAAAGTRSCAWVRVISNSSLSLVSTSILRLATGNGDRNVESVEFGRVAPAQLLPLLGGQRGGYFADVTALPVRIAGT